MRHTSWLLAVCLVAYTAMGVPRADASRAPLERLTAFAVDMSNMAGRTKAGVVDITIDRWSTDQEKDQLTAALKEKGSDGLLRALQKIHDPVGRINSPGSLGYPLRFALEIPSGNRGRRIIIGTDRPVSFLETWHQTRTLDYPFMLIDLRLGPNGEGEGKLMPFARINANGHHVVEIENYASEPVRLTSVKKAS